MREIDKIMRKIAKGKMEAFPPDREAVTLSVRIPFQLYKKLINMKLDKKVKSIQAAVIKGLELITK